MRVYRTENGGYRKGTWFEEHEEALWAFAAGVLTTLVVLIPVIIC